ncbi:hypothetical protein IJH02_02005 [Candidatus Saccharibacteria bacterium]|nr:hypothetical protein [Candidatus Saccharibacteria bacterium]
MTTAEATISMVNRLSEAEMLNVQKYIKQILAKRKRQQERVDLKRYTKKEFLALIDKSIEQSKRGEGYSWEEVQKEFHEEYGL